MSIFLFTHWLEVSVGIALTVYVRYSCHYLSEEYSGFLLRQLVFRYNVIKQLSLRAILKPITNQRKKMNLADIELVKKQRRFFSLDF